MSLWVSTTRLAAFLTAARLRPVPPDDLSNMLELDTALYAAQDEFEARVAIRPFVASVQTRLFDPPGPNQASGTVLAGLAAGINPKGGGRRLFLRGGLLDCDGLWNGVTGDTPNGEAVTLGSVSVVGDPDAWVRPYDSLYQKRGFQYIEFRYPQYGDPQSIQVTGLWGAGTTFLDGAMAASSTNLVSSGLNQYDVGHYMRVKGAGPLVGGYASNLETTISAVDSTGTQVTLATAATTAVTGAIGFYASAPKPVAQGVMAYAAFLLAPQIALYISKGLLMWRQGDVERTFSRGKGSNPVDEFSDRCLAQWNQCLSLYRRPWIA